MSIYFLEYDRFLFIVIIAQLKAVDQCCDDIEGAVVFKCRKESRNRDVGILLDILQCSCFVFASFFDYSWNVEVPVECLPFRLTQTSFDQVSSL